MALGAIGANGDADVAASDKSDDDIVTPAKSRKKRTLPTDHAQMLSDALEDPEPLPCELDRSVGRHRVITEPSYNGFVVLWEAWEGSNEVSK